MQNITVLRRQCHHWQITAFMAEDKLTFSQESFHSTIICSGIIDYYLLSGIWVTKYVLKSEFFRRRATSSKWFLNTTEHFCIKNSYKNTILSFQKFILKLERSHFQEHSLTLKFSVRIIIKWLSKIFSPLSRNATNKLLK